MEIEVKGHSGCQIDIINFGNKNELRVLKSTSDPLYKERLCKQARKQEKFYNLDLDNVRVPQIYNIETHDNSASFQMEFIYSSNFLDFFEKTSVDQIDTFINTILLFVENSINRSEIEDLDTSVMRDKYLDVKKKILDNNLLNGKADVQSILKTCDKIFDINGTIPIPIGICHGDLTLSNILFNGDNICLIDFLDSFVESPICDIVKIRQDTFYGWSLLMYTGKYDGVRMKIILDYIDQKINDFFCQYEWYRKYYHIFDVMNLLRILQYAKESEIAFFLMDSIKKTI